MGLSQVRHFLFTGTKQGGQAPGAVDEKRRASLAAEAGKIGGNETLRRGRLSSGPGVWAIPRKHRPGVRNFFRPRPALLST